MTPHLDGLIALLNKIRAASWEKEYSITKDEESNIDRLRNDTRNDYTTCIDCINASVFNGEYTFPALTSLKVDEINNQLNEIGQQLTALASDADTQFSGVILYVAKGYSIFLSRLLTFYKRLVDVTESKIKLRDDVKIIFDSVDLLYEDMLTDVGSGDNLTYYYRCYNCTKYNIELSKIDLSFKYEDSVYRLISDIALTLMDPHPDEYKHSTSIRQKCNLLKAKYLLRKNELVKSEGYAVVIAEDNYTENSLGRELVEYSINHYELVQDFEKKIYSAVKDLEEENVSALTTRDIHRAIKYYKDIFQDSTITIHDRLNKLTEYKNELEKRFLEEKKETFDKYARALALNYATNNWFSFILQHNGTDIGKIDEYYKQILRIQQRTQINNFFPHLRYFEYVIGRIVKLSDEENKSIFDSIDEVTQILNTGRELREHYKVSIRWCLNNLTYVFQEPYKESFIGLSDKSYLNDGNIFISSTVALPMVEKKYLSEYDEINKKFIEVETKIKIYKRLKTEFQQLHGTIGSHLAQIKNIKEENKESSKRTIEIVTIFTSVVAFITASSNVFHFLEDVYDVVLFMVTLFAGLASFSLLVIVITSFFSNNIEEGQEIPFSKKISHLIYTKGFNVVIVLAIIILPISALKIAFKEKQEYVKQKKNLATKNSDSIDQVKKNTDHLDFIIDSTLEKTNNSTHRKDTN